MGRVAARDVEGSANVNAAIFADFGRNEKAKKSNSVSSTLRTMSERNLNETAFKDNFTQRNGSTFVVMVEPVFDEQVSSPSRSSLGVYADAATSQITEAASFISRSKPETERADYVANLSQLALAAAPPAPELSHDDEESDDDDSTAKKPEPVESEQTRQEKRKVVTALVGSLQGARLQGTDREFEGFSNLILSLLLSLFDLADYSTLLLILVDALAQNSIRFANPSTTTRYSAIAAVFNSLPVEADNEESNKIAAGLKLTILLKLIAYASANDDFTIIKPVLSRFPSWLAQWGFSRGSPGEEEGNAAVLSIVKSLSKGKKSEARSILLAHLSSQSVVEGTATTISTSTATLASKLISLSLAQPDYFDFSSLASLPLLATPSAPALRTLLDIFLSASSTPLPALEFFLAVESNKALLGEWELDAASLGRKLRLVGLAGLCSERVGETVRYEEIAGCLGLSADGDDDGEQVEIWVIDGSSFRSFPLGSLLSSPLHHSSPAPSSSCNLLTLRETAIRAQLISGRLSQSLKTFQVTRAAPRQFTPAHWKGLQGRLAGWRSSLDEILDSVSKAVGGAEGNGAEGLLNGGGRREISA